jgi:LacI family transcriptional regulator
LLGVLQHAHAEGWQLLSTTSHQLNPSTHLDGAIGEFLFEENATAPQFDLSDLGVGTQWFGLPRVSLADPTEVSGPQVAIDFVAVGDLAARHLRATGFQQFAFLGIADQRATRLQLAGFMRPLQRADLPCTALMLHPGSTGQLSEWITSWVRGLPTHTAVHCVNDELALQVSVACQTHGRSIPTDIALLGVGNDELLCAFPRVALSSIALPNHTLGLRSAQLLTRLMRADSAPTRHELLPPTEVVARGSTLSFATAPLAAQRAIRFMREHAYRGISVQDVLDHAKLSRRSLENHVRAVLGHAPHQELVRLRVERATHLLDSSSLSVLEIARRAGFSDGRQMSETFRRHLALTPSQYRRRQRRSSRDSERPSSRRSGRQETP